MIEASLVNTYRRSHPFIRNKVNSVLPDYFVDAYPRLSLFIEAYYRFAESPDSPSKEIHDIFTLSDITALDSKFLNNLEFSLLLGQNSFKGLNDSRLALKLSNMLYKSKGTRYSVEQFFRIFFGEDVEVIYTKENVFIVGESQIGPESLRYLIDDKLYQTFAVLIRTGVSAAEWIDNYKLFVHPAGLYVGTEVVIQSAAMVWPGPPTRFMDSVADDNTSIGFEVLSLSSLARSADPVDLITSIKWDSAADSYYRINTRDTIDFYDSATINMLNIQYNDIEEMVQSHGPTFDMDSVGSGQDLRTIKMSNTIETMDEYSFKFYDSV